jgi:amino-acid N-acetyltransferase
MKFGDLRTILRYVPQFQGRTFIVALDGGVIASENLSNVLLDLAALRSLGIRVVLIFDASPQVQALARSRRVKATSTGGDGPTDRETLDVAIDAVGRTANRLVQQLTVLGVRTVAAANLLTVRKAGILGGIDQQLTGKVHGVDTASLHTLLSDNILPVVAPLGYDRKGQTLALDADWIAVEIGVALRAQKVIYLAGPGQLPFPDGPSSQFSVRHLREELERRPDLPPGARTKLQCAARACEQGVARVHLIPGLQDEAILAELFSSEGIGTMIHVDVYETLRPAALADLEAMVQMTRRAVEEGQLLPRSREEILERLDDYCVVEMDNNLVGIVAVHLYPGEDAAEVASLHVLPTHLGRGYGAALMRWVEQRAREAGVRHLFGYTTQASDYFIDRCGFEACADSSFVPRERLDKARASARNSRLVHKWIGPADGVDA